MPDDQFISVQAVTKRFGDVTAVSEVSLDIGRGEFFGLLGPSGCGKTTLLRMLAGFESPDDGSILIDGEHCTHVPPHQRPVNMVFQNYAIFPHLNVFQNIAYGLRKDGLSKRELKDKVEEALALIKLPGFGDRESDQLSGGQRQRVALARALVKKPKVLLLDEPLGALDKKLREQMQLELRELQRNLGITFVFVTHDQEEALTMSDRIAVMSAGEILEIGSPDRLYEKPQTRFTADFLGSMNFLPGVIDSVEAESYTVNVPGLGLLAGLNGAAKYTKEEAVTVAIRPENLTVSTEPGAGAIRGKVSGVAYLGDRAHIYIDVPGCEEALLVAMQNTGGLVSGAALDNADVALRFDPQSVLLLKN